LSGGEGKAGLRCFFVRLRRTIVLRWPLHSIKVSARHAFLSSASRAFAVVQ
jgi:hypothetical protein